MMTAWVILCFMASVCRQLEVVKEQGGKIGVHTLIAADELIGNMRPCFLSQKMDAEGPEKKMPSTAVKVTKRSLKVEC
jgi:hypothetical protein